ncbi:MAG TPA: hypothetical protein VHC19_04095 [Pirellulales bacterium]|nr:hypothetical protein [Pirellulales bacterium]
MPRFRLLAVCMALAVTFNHFHCVGTSALALGVAAELGQRARLDATAPADMGAIPECENETGCICQGAIFVSAPAVDVLNLASCQWIIEPCAELVTQSGQPDLVAAFATLERENFARPISGRAMRAWLASFLI